MRRFLVLLKKELAELITPQVILPFVVVILMFGMLGQTMSSLSAEQESTFPIAVADRDGGPFAGVVLDALERSGFEPKLIDDAPDEDTVTAILDDLDANIVIRDPVASRPRLPPASLSGSSRGRECATSPSWGTTTSHRSPARWRR